MFIYSRFGRSSNAPVLAALNLAVLTFGLLY